MSEEVEKLKNLATNPNLLASEKGKAIEALGDIKTTEGALALLDLAGDTGLLASHREKALEQARKVLRSL